MQTVRLLKIGDFRREALSTYFGRKFISFFYHKAERSPYLFAARSR